MPDVSLCPPGNRPVKRQNRLMTRPIVPCASCRSTATGKRLLGSRRQSGYNMARMRHEIVFSPGSVKEWRSLPAHDRAKVRDAIEKHLRHEPTRVSRSRIRRLRGLSQPQYRLRVDDIRVFYDVEGTSVQILAIVSKAKAEAWLKAAGLPDAGSGPGEG